MLPDAVCDGVKKRGPGRPRTVPPQQSVFRLVFSFDYAEKLSNLIAKNLGVPASALTYNLAHITLAYGPMRELQKRGKVKSGCTRRSRIHLAVLLYDVAKMYATLTGSDAQVELRKINGFREDRKVVGTKNGDTHPPVEVLAKIVMAMWGDEFDESLQRQARAALKLI